MIEDDKIRVLLVEDDRMHLAMAKAGLIPQSEDEPDRADIKTRALLADEYYHIRLCYSIDQAINALPSFKPDLAIIDVDLGEGGTQDKIKNGIDFYRHLGTLPHLRIEKLLFSSHYATASVFKKLSDQERLNFVPKGTAGTGYEMLAARIAWYLKKVAANILRNASSAVAKKIADDLEVTFFSKIGDYPYSFGNRLMSLNHLLMFCSTIEKDIRNKDNIILSYRDPGPEFMALLNFAPKAPETDRAEWKQSYLQNALLYYENKLAVQYEPEIIGETKNTIRKLFQHVEKSPCKRLTGVDLNDFSPKSFKDRRLDGNEKFLNNFRNALVIRRTIIFLDILASKLDERVASRLTRSATNFLGGYIEQTFQAIKQKDEVSPEDLTQYGDMLNFSFKKNKDSGKCLAAACRIYSFEDKWLNSEDFRMFMAEIERLVTR